MPSAFDAEFLSVAVPDIEETFGESVTLIAANGAEFSVTATVRKQEAPLEDNRANKRRVERCSILAREAEREEGDLIALEHDDGPIVVETRLALLLEGDGPQQKWDFDREGGRSGGMIRLWFQRIKADETGDLTPGIGR